MGDRSLAIYKARVFIAESHRRGNTKFAWTLLEWAANARRKATRGYQPDLFGAGNA